MTSQPAASSILSSINASDSLILKLNTKNAGSSNKLLTSVEQFSDPNWAPTGMQNMEEIRRCGKLCDITLVANGHKFFAHRIVLAANIPYFNAMFLNEMKEMGQDVVSINSVDHLCLEQFINYSYNGKITITNENVQSVLIGANFFHMKNIKSACCEFIKKRLTISEALTVRSFAHQLMCLDLVESADRFINRNFKKVVQTQEYLNMEWSEVGALLGRDELGVDSEEQVYEALIKWIKTDPAKKAKYLPELLKCVRLPLVAPVYLVETVAQEDMIRNDLSSRDLIDEATHYHLLPDKRSQFKTFNLKVC
jgi:kelch-like protein 18